MYCTEKVLQRYETWFSTKSFVVQVAPREKETQAALSEPLSTERAVPQCGSEADVSVQLG